MGTFLNYGFERINNKNKKKYFNLYIGTNMNTSKRGKV